MAELQWGHGDDAVEDITGGVNASAAPYELQWGHGDDAVEDDTKNLIQNHCMVASMGPRR